MLGVIAAAALAAGPYHLAILTSDYGGAIDERTIRPMPDGTRTFVIIAIFARPTPVGGRMVQISERPDTIDCRQSRIREGAVRYEELNGTLVVADNQTEDWKQITPFTFLAAERDWVCGGKPSKLLSTTAPSLEGIERIYFDAIGKPDEMRRR